MPSLLSSSCYALGNFVFKLQHCDRDMLDALDRLFLKVEDTPDVKILEMGCETEIRPLIAKAMKHHRRCLWISGAALVSPEGKTLLVTGCSGVGKSTIATALAYVSGWEIICEDIVFIDTFKDEMIVFATPLSMKEGTPELLEREFNLILEPGYMNEWVPMQKKAPAKNLPAKIDLALHFELSNGFTDGSLKVVPMSMNDHMKKLLTLSNMIHEETHCEKLACYMPKNSYQLQGGSPSDRLAKIHELINAKG